MKSLIPVLICWLCLCGCNRGNQSADKNKGVQIVSLRAPDRMASSDSYDREADSEVAAVIADSAASVADPEIPSSIDQKIIKHGHLRFETSNLEETYAQVRAAVAKYKATIQNDSEGKDYNSLYKNLTIRVPNQDFDNFIADLSKGVSYFDTKEISSQDVTEEYIDIDARLNAKKILETRYFELLRKASKVSEMIEIEKQLSEIREEIESKEGQLRYMKNRIAMSTVNIEFYKTIAQESGVTVSYGSKIWNALKSGFNGISGFFIGLLESWPFIVILVAVFYLIRKRFKKKRINNENLS